MLIKRCDIIRFGFLNSHSGCSVENEVKDDVLLVQVDQ